MDRKNFLKSIFGGFIGIIGINNLPTKSTVPDPTDITPLGSSGLQWYSQYQPIVHDKRYMITKRLTGVKLEDIVNGKR